MSVEAVSAGDPASLAKLLSTPVLKHGELLCIALHLSVCLSVHDFTKIQTRK